jgi:hypothetical protein
MLKTVYFVFFIILECFYIILENKDMFKAYVSDYVLIFLKKF